jgi:hypothetical protein
VQAVSVKAGNVPPLLINRNAMEMNNDNDYAD